MELRNAFKLLGSRVTATKAYGSAMRDTVKTLALICKLTAILFWLGSGYFVLIFDVRDLRATSPPHNRETPQDWGTPAYFHRTYFRIGEAAVLAILALTPNRMLVSSRIVFAISLAAALIPLHRLFVGDL